MSIIKSFKKFLIPALVVLISLYTFYPSFKLALFGDDWLAIWRYYHYFGPEVVKKTGYFTHFVSGYGAYEITSGKLYSIFGPQSNAYYTISYIYRLIAAFSLWPLTFYLTRSKLAAFFASLFFSVTAIGLQTTDWVFNSTSYLSITFFSIFLYFFIKSKEESKFSLFILSAICYYLTYIFAPVRMTGLLPFAILLELFLSLKAFNIKSLIIRLSTILGIFLIISSASAVVENQGRLITGAIQIINSSLSTFATLLTQGHFDFLLNPIISIGRLIIPDIALANSPNQKNVLLIIGSITIISAIFFLYRTRKNRLSICFFIGFFWIIFSFIFTWIRALDTLFTTDHRYFIPSAAGITIFLASFIGLGKGSKSRIILFLMLLCILIIHLFFTRSYLENKVIKNHGLNVVTKIWSTFPYIPEIGKNKDPLVFYFQPAQGKEELLHDSVTFGFPYHIALIYKIYDSYYKMPIAMDNWNDVVSAVKNGDSLVPNGFTKEPVPIENVYAFYLDENNNLLNVTDEVRKKLRYIIFQ